MTRGIARWLAASALLLALTACTSLTDADGLTSPPVATPSPTQLSEWEKEQISFNTEQGISDELVYAPIQETESDPFTKETLPDPQSMIPTDAINAISISEVDSARKQLTLRLPQRVTGGMLSLDFVCVDGTIEIESVGISEILCDGSRQGYSVEIDKEVQSFKMTVTPGISFSIAVYESPDVTAFAD